MSLRFVEGRPISANRTRIREQNQKVKQENKGVRILPFFLPTKSPWRGSNRAESWVHAKKAVWNPMIALGSAVSQTYLCSLWLFL